MLNKQYRSILIVKEKIRYRFRGCFTHQVSPKFSKHRQISHLNSMPTGGGILDNRWFVQGRCFCVNFGANQLSPAITGDFEKVTEIVKQYMKKCHKIKAD